MARLYLTADPHFWHENIIGYCSRPFPDAESMNAAMIERWNAKVTPEDRIIVVGDAAFCGAQKFRDVFVKLNGHKELVPGNHDLEYSSKRVPLAERKLKSFLKDGFEVIHPREGIALGRLWVQHWPCDPPPGFELTLCGHVHERWATRDRAVNVGVDVRGFAPVTLEELGIDPRLAEAT